MIIYEFELWENSLGRDKGLYWVYVVLKGYFNIKLMFFEVEEVGDLDGIVGVEKGIKDNDIGFCYL